MGNTNNIMTQDTGRDEMSDLIGLMNDVKLGEK